MNWRFILTPSAEKDIRRLDRLAAERIEGKLAWLADHFEELIPFALHGKYAGSFKLRAGDWRIVYEIDHHAQTVWVLNIKHRSEVYKKRR